MSRKKRLQVRLIIIQIYCRRTQICQHFQLRVAVYIMKEFLLKLIATKSKGTRVRAL